jgi:hypothetical protein
VKPQKVRWRRQDNLIPGSGPLPSPPTPRNRSERRRAAKTGRTATLARQHERRTGQ